MGPENAWLWNLLGLLSVPALVVLNGFFVAAECALVAVRKTQVEEMVRQGVRQAKMVEQALVRLDRSIAATQLGITLASIAIGWVGEPAFARLLHPVFAALPGGWGSAATHSAATALAFLVITFTHVVFGELIPKSLAMQTPTSTALWLAGPLVTFSKVTRPLTILMSLVANAIIRLLGYEPAPGEEMIHTVEELGLLVEDSEEAGVLAPEQAQYVQNVFRLSSKKVKDCLVPAERMAALEINTPPDKVLEAVRSGAHTRMPVYEGTLDNVVGIVNTKDLFYLFSLQGVVILQDALYPALFLTPEATMTDALKVFRREHRPMALVRDTTGKVLGLVTLEDILEEIVGDIEDEHDRPTPKLRLRRPRPLSRPIWPTRK
jgi:putative hemolysin